MSAIDDARRDVDFVAGVVLIEGRTPFERALALTHYPSPAELHDPGLFVRISHRLFGRGYDPDRVGGAYMAFSKAVWTAVRGFPDELSASEDHTFSSEVVVRGFRFARARGAAVRWSPPGSWRGNAEMFLRYSRSDIRVRGRMRHGIRATVWSAALLTLLRGGWAARLGLGLGVASYIALPVRRARAAGYPLRHWWRFPLVVALEKRFADRGRADRRRRRDEGAPGGGNGKGWSVAACARGNHARGRQVPAAWRRTLRGDSDEKRQAGGHSSSAGWHSVRFHGLQAINSAGDPAHEDSPGLAWLA